MIILMLAIYPLLAISLCHDEGVKMKKIVIMFIIAIYLNCITIPAQAYSFEINTTGVYIITGVREKEDIRWKYLQPLVDPFITNGVTMIPLKEFAEVFGYKVVYLERGQKALVQNINDEKNLVFTIGSISVLLNGNKDIMPRSPVIQKGVILIPLRYVAERFGLNVEWKKIDQKNHLIWVSESSMLCEDDCIPDDNYILEVDNVDPNARLYHLKQDGITSKGVKIKDSYERVIELYGAPDKIDHQKDGTVKRIVYSREILPEFDMDKYLIIEFGQGLVTTIDLILID